MTTILNNDLSTATEILRALAHPLRMKIISFIDKQQKINVNKIYNTLKLEQSITSQHLRILRKAGLVDTVRDGKFIFYSVNYDKLKQVNMSIESFVEKESSKTKV